MFKLTLEDSVKNLERCRVQDGYWAHSEESV